MDDSSRRMGSTAQYCIESSYGSLQLIKYTAYGEFQAPDYINLMEITIDPGPCLLVATKSVSGNVAK